jgi:hypothetical protein
MPPVLQAFSRAGYTLWLHLSIWFVTWHYLLMAGLVVGDVRRAAGGMHSRPAYSTCCSRMHATYDASSTLISCLLCSYYQATPCCLA